MYVLLQALMENKLNSLLYGLVVSYALVLPLKLMISSLTRNCN